MGQIVPEENAILGGTAVHLTDILQVPETSEEAIYTSNPIERMNKEIRKRLKPMNSLTNMDSAEKIIYLNVIGYNDRFGDWVIRGFGDLEVKQKLNEMFEERYPV